MKQDFTKLDRLLQEFAGRTVPGCACAVMQDGELVYEGCYGRADLAAQTPVTSRSMFRQENLSHLFTYTVLAMLYEQGKFLYSDPIGEYLPVGRIFRSTWSGTMGPWTRFRCPGR